MVFTMAAPQLWSPDRPFLYRVVIQIQNDPTGVSPSILAALYLVCASHVIPESCVLHQGINSSLDNSNQAKCQRQVVGHTASFKTQTAMFYA